MPYRIAHRGLRRGFYLLLLAGVVASFLALGIVVADSLSVNTRSIEVACTQVRKLEIVIEAVLTQTLHTFGRKGTSGYAYYRAHPGELAAGRLALKREIAAFSPYRC